MPRPPLPFKHPARRLPLLPYRRLNQKATLPDTDIQTLVMENPELKNDSLSGLDLTDYFPELNDPFVEKQHRMMTNVESNQSSLKQIHEIMNEMRQMMKDFFPQLKPAKPFTIQQSSSTETEKMPSSLHSSKPKRTAQVTWRLIDMIYSFFAD